VALAGTHVLGERTFTPAEHLVTRSEPRHVLADRLDLPGDVGSPDRLLRCAQPVPRHADDEGASPHDVPVGGIDGGCVHAHQHVAIAGGRALDLPEFEDIR
jgi:hypothetical protein